MWLCQNKGHYDQGFWAGWRYCKKWYNFANLFWRLHQNHWGIYNVYVSSIDCPGWGICWVISWLVFQSSNQSISFLVETLKLLMVFLTMNVLMLVCLQIFGVINWENMKNDLILQIDIFLIKPTLVCVSYLNLWAVNWWWFKMKKKNLSWILNLNWFWSIFWK